ncbi:helix-turn-helix domain-containing protein [Parabacteroides sp. OttesenSCG-928-G07]|nr:helix-turn-helix domain-containing protein [Parabacteroides sp. OttesenSCG-928-G07]
MRCFKLFYLFLFFSFPLQAQQALKDSLIHQSTIQTGEDKLFYLYELVKLTLGTYEHIYYLDLLEKEALRQGDHQSYVRALANKVTYYYNVDTETDSLFYYANIAKEFALKYHNYEAYFDVETHIINKHIRNASYEIAIYQAKALFDKAKELNSIDGEIAAYECQGIAYTYAGRPGEAIAPLKSGIDLLIRYRPDRITYLMELYFHLIQALHVTGDYASAINYCEQLDKLFVDFESNKKGTKYENLFMDDYRLQLEAMYALNYALSGEQGKAKEALERADVYAEQEMDELYYQQLNYAYAHYYYAITDYVKALEYLEKTILFYKEYALNQFLKAAELKADILADMHQYREAFVLNKEIAHLRDSLATENFTRQMAEQRTIYQVDKLEYEAARHQLRNKYILAIAVGLIFAVVLLTIIVFIIRRNAIRLKEKNYKLYQQLKERDEQSKFQIYKSKEEKTPAKSKSLQEQVLFERILLYLQQTSYFLEPDITREKLALKLGTNRQYLCDAIQEATGQTFNDFINNLRLEYAKDMLLNNHDNSIEDIFYSSGFTNKSTFYRLFRKKYGLTPVEVREIERENVAI